MIFFPPCKINLGLHILSKRADGYHELETLFYPLPFFDVLEILPASRPGWHPLGLPIPGDPALNLCLRAAETIRAHSRAPIPALDIWLFKRIPPGSGLGGGSADGAFTLRGINEQFAAGLSQHDLNSLALELGSDCPFFLGDQPCIARGRGEILLPVDIDLSDYSILLVHPDIHISTAWAFAQSRPNPFRPPLSEILNLPVGQWRDRLSNDLEAPAIQAYPQIGQWKEALYEAGAVYASLTGSGSSLYGLFLKGGRPSFRFEINCPITFIG
jgi:4-diphosphocytidyl-2-C-methyl-D-erythritol kinase